MGVKKGALTLCHRTDHVDIPIVGIQLDGLVLRDQVPNHTVSRVVEKNGLVGVPAEEDAM